MRYDFGLTQERYPFIFATPDAPESQELRKRYGLEALVAGSDDLEKVRRLCAWAHSLWQHDGLNEPSSPDALTILEEAAQGKSFRCVEYGVVMAACASALGLPSRVLALKTQDAATREFGAGHVVSEVFLPDLGRWVFVDGQCNVIPIRDGQPLNGAELRLALDDTARVTSFSEVSRKELDAYLPWIDEYLFYFSTSLDNRTFGEFTGPSLMLVPLGAETLSVFQRRFQVLNTTYTRSVNAFYPSPARVNPDP